MLKFFRKIRQQLVTDNNLKKYLIYALGEIVLVVIGILIALSINNWNQANKNNRVQKVYLEQIKNELEANGNLMEGLVLKRFERKMAGLRQAKSYAKNTFTPKDTMAFLNEVGYGAVFGNGINFLNSSVFEELKNTGNIHLISNDSLKKDIFDYQDEVSKQIINVRNFTTDYLSYTNSLRVFYHQNPDSIAIEDKNFMLEKLKSEKTIFLSNNEINYANEVHKMVKSLNARTNALISRIELELDK